MDHLAKFRLAFEITSLPLVLVNSDGQILLANEPFCTLFDYNAGVLEQQTVELLIPPDKRGHHPAQREAFFRLPTKRAMGAGRDVRAVSRTGRIIPLELAIEPVTIGDQSCAMLTAIDITERKKREEQLRQALDATASGMVLSNAEGRIVLINYAACRLLGYEPSELTDAPIEKLVPIPARVSHSVLMQNALDSPMGHAMSAGRSVEALHKSGRTVPVEIALNKIDTPDGWLVMSTITDLREQIAFQDAMQGKNEMLAALNDELSQFAYSASHDLKAPLVSMMGLLRICLEDIADNDTGELVSNLQKALEIAERSGHQIERILELARSGHEALPVSPVPLAEVVRALWENLCAADDHPRMRVAVPEDLRLVTEKGTLIVILDNLLSNALKYRDPKKDRLEVEVRAHQENGSTWITVTDNGCGIPAQHQKEIFEMFQRFDPRSGAGLGLALVQKNIARLGGDITVSSKCGAGTRMTISLPSTHSVEAA